MRHRNDILWVALLLGVLILVGILLEPEYGCNF